MACHPHAGQWHRAVKPSWAAKHIDGRRESSAILILPNTTLRVHLWRQRGASSRLEIRPTEHISQVSQIAPCFSIFTAVELSARPGLERTIRTVHHVEPHALRSDRYLCIVYYQRRPRTRARSLQQCCGTAPAAPRKI